MNKDSHLIFEAYKNRLLNELSPVELSDYSGTGEEIKADFPELSRGKYDLTPEETSQVYKTFLTNFKEKGGKSPKLYKDFYEMELAPVIREIKPSINSTNSKYSARVLYNALKTAGVVKDERDGVQGIKMEKNVSSKGVEKLTKYTLQNAGELGKEEKTDSKVQAGEGIDDPVMKRFWEKIYGEGEYSREELQRMFIEDNPDLEESEARINISSLIRSGYLTKTESGNYEAVDPEETKENQEKEGEGSGEITSGYDPEEIDNIDNDPYGGVYVGPTRGSGGMD